MITVEIAPAARPVRGRLGCDPTLVKLGQVSGQLSFDPIEEAGRANDRSSVLHPLVSDLKAQSPCGMRSLTASASSLICVSSSCGRIDFAGRRLAVGLLEFGS
jgi:hypothetical protein